MKYLFSIIIPTNNGEKTIGKLMEKIASFGSNYSKEVIIIDSSSSDRTVRIVKQFRKKLSDIKIIKIKKKEFNHGETRNLGVKLSLGEYVCYFSQDAVPKSKNLLDYYREDLSLSPKVIAVYGKHFSNDSTPVIQKVEADCFWDRLDPYVNKKGLLVKNLRNPFLPFIGDNKELWCQISDTSSCYRKAFLLKNPFPKTMYGEDMLIGKKIIENNLSIVYDIRCGVLHSHSFNLRDYYQREKESLGLVVNGMKLSKRINVVCKINKILGMKISFINKAFYFGELVIYYFLKLIILLSLKFFPKQE